MIDPAYYAWYPTLGKGGGTASIILTPGHSRRAPTGGRDFFEAILEAVGIEAELNAWGVQPFLSSYFVTADWEEGWLASLLVGNGRMTRPATDVVNRPIMTTAETQDALTSTLPVRVFADFTSSKKVKDCRAELKAHAAEAKWNEIHYERYATRDIGVRHKQLVVDVVTCDRSRLIGDFSRKIVDAVAHVITTCERYDGRTRAPAVSP